MLSARPHPPCPFPNGLHQKLLRLIAVTESCVIALRLCLRHIPGLPGSEVLFPTQMI